MTDDDTGTPADFVGFACTVCGEECDDADERLDHWIVDHADLLPDGFADRVGDDDAPYSTTD